MRFSILDFQDIIDFSFSILAVFWFSEL